MKKRGQFYLVAALVIIAVIASLSVVYNEAKSSDNNVVIYDLSNEINFEILQLLDSGYFNSQNQTQLDDLIRSIIESYSLAYPYTTMIFIYGDSQKVNIIAYFTEPLGTICFNGCFEIKKKEFFSDSLDLISGQETIFFEINDESYTFNVKEYGQNFYLVLKSEGPDDQIFKTKTGQKCNSGADCTENKICVEGNCEIPQGDCGTEGRVCCQGNSCSNNLICYDIRNGNDKKCYKKCTELPDGYGDVYCNSLVANSICKIQTDRCILP